jgi:hypothetical protein
MNVTATKVSIITQRVLQTKSRSIEKCDDDELIEMALIDIAQPQSGKLTAFAPVVSNILRGWLHK